MTTEIPNPANGAEIKAYHIQPGQVFRTHGGERVEVVADDGHGSKVLEVRFPEREPQLTEDGEPREYHVQFMSRYSFADAANYEGYALITEDGPVKGGEDSEDDVDPLAGKFVGTPRCPDCGAFMSTGFGGMGLPAASCSRDCDGGFMDDRELIRGGYFVED